MKKALYILPLAALAISGCKKYDYTRDLDKYSDVIFYSENIATGEATISDLGSIEVQGDLATSTYTVQIKNVQLFDGAPLKSATVSNLIQYYQEKSEEEKEIPLYYFFRQEGQTKTSGDLDVTSMRYAFLSKTYWLSFNSDDDRYHIWSMPRVRSLYANRNSIMCQGNAASENAIHPAYRFTLNMTDHTVSIKAQAPKFPVNPEDVSQTVSFQSLELRDIPVEFTSTGFRFSADRIVPIVNGTPNETYLITGLTAEIAYDYEGTKQMTYKMNASGNRTLSIKTEFDLLQKPNDAIITQ